TRGFHVTGVQTCALPISGGVVSAWKRMVTKAGKLMATFRLEDMTGSLEVLVFPKLYEEVHETAGNDRVVVVKGRLDTAEEEKKLERKSVGKGARRRILQP